jgi:NAD(P)-dependent dehydrogenase (short-subunit alcohol dehydrogenase family)
MTTWFITGANRGLGLEIATTALAAGDTVVATARRPEQAPEALTAYGDRVLVLPLDLTDPASIEAAVAGAVERFGRIDVLVNNAGYGELGAFEEISPAQIERQFRTNVFGVFDVTRAVLPTMRAQRSGHVLTISSLAGIVGIAGSSVYCSTKFAVAGWSESLSEELADFGIRVTVVHPGMFRTDFLDPSSVSHGEVELADYDAFRRDRRAYLTGANHAQLGDPDRFGPAILELVRAEEPPARWPAGSDAVAEFARRAEQLSTADSPWLDLALSTDLSD